MKYFIDTEFLEGKQDKRFLGIKYGETKPTIDLVSIGIVCEDGREYYAISKDFNLKQVWNNKDTWIKENVLLPIYTDEVCGDARNTYDFSYSTMKMVLKSIGKSNEQIAKEIKQFIYTNEEVDFTRNDIAGNEHYSYGILNTNPKFYGYYSDYDWVVFCWLFGNMMQLPKGFPMYCKDLKQMLDEKEIARQDGTDMVELRNLPTYPKQTNEHNALSDAKWNFELFKFLQQL